MKFYRIWADLRVTLLYALFGGMWILFSDRALETLTSDTSTLTALQTYKGWFYVAASALLLFFLLRSETSRRRVVENKHRENEEKYRLLFENSMDAIMLTAPDGSILSANPAACHLFERTEQEIRQLGRNGIVDLTDPRLQAGIEERDRTGMFHGEMTFIRKDGSKFEGDVSSVIFKDGAGNTRTNMIIRDTTERKKAEFQIQDQLRRLQSLRVIDQSITSSMEIIAILEVVLQQVTDLLKADAVAILLLNESTQTLGYTVGHGFRTDAIRRSMIHLGEGLAGQIGSERKSLYVSNLIQAGDRFKRADLLIEDQFVAYIGVPLVAKGSLKGVMEIFQRTSMQIDEEWLNYLESLADQAAIAIENAQLFEGLQRSNVELEQRVNSRTADLLRMNTELERANHAKDEFLANMSHELRTPLTGILGMAEAIELNTYGQVTKEQTKALKNIEDSGGHLLTLINDILDFSKTEAGKLDIHPEMVSVEEVCQASIIFIKEQARKKSIKVEHQQEVNATALFADPRRLKQILVNLLSNAVKFTPENGRVLLSVRVDQEKEQIHFSVIDNGIGIAPEDLQRLFTPFTQVDGQLNRQYEGTGLGLALVLRLAEIHGGSVSVESEVGVGSNFTVSLPWQPQQVNKNRQQQLETQANPSATANGLLLLVEDNETNVEAIADYLKFCGHTLVLASNGMEALVKAEEYAPELILMDIQMPVMDGLEAIRRLRMDSRFASTPIIALTALAMTGDRDRCLQAGANEYMSKPVSPKQLSIKIAELLQNKNPNNI